MKKYGPDKFNIELLRNDATNYRELMEQEKAEIVKQDTYHHGYNSTPGGETVFNARPFEVDGKTFVTLSAAAEYYGVPEPTLRARVDAMGWPHEEAVGLKPRKPSKYHQKSVTHKGVTYPDHKALAKAYGIPYKTLRLRISRYNWTLAQSVGDEPPPDEYPGAPKKIVVEGVEYPSLSEAARHYELTGALVSGRLNRGWPKDQAFGLVPPPPMRKCPGTSIEYAGKVYPSVAEFAIKFGVNYKVVHKRLKKG